MKCFLAPNVVKARGVMVDCENCVNLEKEVSYLKSSLQRFSNGKKQLNMILDQSKVTSYNRGVGFDVHDYFTKNQPNVLSVTEYMLVFLNDITRNIIPSNGAEIFLVYYGYRVHPQAHGYTILAFHFRVFQGYRICLIPW